MDENYCCAMRRHFLIGMVGIRNDEPTPTDVVDFIHDFNAKPAIILIKFCPFCGAPIDNSQTLRTPDVPPT